MSRFRPDRRRSQLGQATAEYVGSVLLIAVLIAAAAALGTAAAGGALPRALASSLLCAVGTRDECMAEASGLSPLERVYGPELAALVAGRAPEIWFEDGDFVSLPVDYRECRERTCSDSIRHGALEHTQTGLSPVAFTHVIDCRTPAAGSDGPDCSGSRAGRIYLQYWLYYPDSRTGPATSITGGFHLDDWESYGIRIEPTGDVMARASSHHSYNGREGGLGSVSSDAGWSEKAGWDTVLGDLRVAAGSHAGTTQRDPDDDRHVEPDDLVLIPLEPIAAAGGAPAFEVSPPWEKGVWEDPESTGT